MRPWLSLLVAALVVAAGCTRTTPVATGATLRVALSEYRIEPQSVRAPAGALAIVVHNYGRMSHDLVISYDGTPEAATAPLAPGQTVDLSATLSPGRYLMSSTILSDQALGAYATLTVTR